MSINFTEAKLEQVIIELLGEQGFTHVLGETLVRKNNEQVLITDDLRTYLASQYQADDITTSEIDSIIRQLATLPATDLYDSNKTFCHWLSNGFLFKREDRNKKDLYIELIDTQHLPAALTQLFAAEQPPLQQVAENKITYLPARDNNCYKVVNRNRSPAPA